MWSRREIRSHAAAASLRVAVTSTGLELTKDLRMEVRRRMLLAMSRFGPEVDGVTARLAERHNPLGGVDQRCRVRARLRSGLVLRAEAVNGALEAAVSRSSARLARLVAAELGGGDGRPPWRPRGSEE
jgi:ribosome-associated translation inhibitor RaiA